MKRLFTIFIFSVLSLAVFAQNEEGDALPPELIASPGSPILLSFTADWCQPCHRMRDEIFPSETIAPLLAKLNVVMVDTETLQGALLQKKYCEIAAIPYYVLLDKDQNFVSYQLGASDAETFAAFLRQVIDEDSDEVEGGMVSSRKAFRPKWTFGVSVGGTIQRPDDGCSARPAGYAQAVARMNFFNGDFIDTGVFYSTVFGVGVPVDMNLKVVGPLSLGFGAAASHDGQFFDFSLRGRADISLSHFSVGGLFSWGAVNRDPGNIVEPVHNRFCGLTLSYIF